MVDRHLRLLPLAHQYLADAVLQPQLHQRLGPGTVCALALALRQHAIRLELGHLVVHVLSLAVPDFQRFAQFLDAALQLADVVGRLLQVHRRPLVDSLRDILLLGQILVGGLHLLLERRDER